VLSLATYLGKVIGRAGEHYRVDIGNRFEALLHFYTFEGATKEQTSAGVKQPSVRKSPDR
jgi:exosome complex RNA-binding protein Rrp4